MDFPVVVLVAVLAALVAFAIVRAAQAATRTAATAVAEKAATRLSETVSRTLAEGRVPPKVAALVRDISLETVDVSTEDLFALASASGEVELEGEALSPAQTAALAAAANAVYEDRYGSFDDVQAVAESGEEEGFMGFGPVEGLTSPECAHLQGWEGGNDWKLRKVGGSTGNLCCGTQVTGTADGKPKKVCVQEDGTVVDVTGSFRQATQNELVAKGFKWGWGKNAGKLCNAVGDCYDPGNASDIKRARAKRHVGGAAKVSVSGGKAVVTKTKDVGKICTWGGKDQSSGWVPLGGGAHCCAKTSCLCRNMKTGKGWTTSNPTHRNGACARTGSKNKNIADAREAAKAAKAPKGAKKINYKDGIPCPPGWTMNYGNCCQLKGCSCAIRPGKVFATTDPNWNSGKCAKGKAAPAAKPAAAAKAMPFCSWGGKDQSNGWVQVGGNCCAKNSCTCRDMAKGNLYTTTDRGYRGGACAAAAATKKQQEDERKADEKRMYREGNS